MGGFDWFVAAVLVVIGLSCLTMSATWMFSPDSLQYYAATLFHICLWVMTPLAVLLLVYITLRMYIKTKGKSIKNRD
ncbi:hypothetical protein [Thalassobacillus sp. C254]|uniref:hypothetical protein n=1 Tax=Thalassobacillus sp. C254 TaxID=1225341 RepID=UPI0006D00497|nr:hypothetical protein [Thalassobacillus sp. C254]